MRWRILPIVGLLALGIAIASLAAMPSRPAPGEVVVGQEGATLSVPDSSAGEGTVGIDVGIARLGSTQENVTFRIDTVAGTAQAGSDFVGLSAPLTIIAGSGGVGVRVPIVHDTLDEDDETLQVRIHEVVGATPSELFATLTILDDDDPPSISIGPGLTVDEGAGTVQLPITLSAVSGRTISVQVSTVAGSAQAGSDFTPVTGTLVQLAPGQTTAVASVPIVDDGLDEPQEQLSVQLGAPTNVTVGTGSATITITDDDPPPPTTTTTTRPPTTTTQPRATTTTVARTVPTTSPPTSSPPTSAPTSTRAPAAEERVRQPDPDGDDAPAREREAGDEQALGPEQGEGPPGGGDPTDARDPGGRDGGDAEAAGPGDEGGQGGSGRSRTEVAQSQLVSSVARPQDLDLTAGSLAASAAAAAGLLGLIAYSSELFDSTFEANERRIRRAMRWLPGRGEAPRHRGLGILACVLAGGAIFTALSDDIALDLTTAMLFAGMTVAVAATSFGVVVADVALVRRRFGVQGIMQAVPTGLLIGAAGVLLSRLIGFHPGYAYGVVAGWAYSARMSDRDEGHLAALTTVNLLAVALAAWVARAPLASAAGGDDPAALAVAADAALTGVFLLCLDSGIVGLIPIRFLRGKSILRWSPPAWAALTFAALTIFVLLVLQPSGSRVLGSDGLGSHVLVLCVGFAGASGAFWAWFRFVPDPYPEPWSPPDFPS